MRCKECDERRQMLRDAIFNAKVADILGHAVKGAAELVGIKEKTATKEARKGKSSAGDAEAVGE